MVVISCSRPTRISLDVVDSDCLISTGPGVLPETDGAEDVPRTQRGYVGVSIDAENRGGCVFYRDRIRWCCRAYPNLACVLLDCDSRFGQIVGRQHEVIGGIG